MLQTDSQLNVNFDTDSRVVKVVCCVWHPLPVYIHAHMFALTNVFNADRLGEGVSWAHPTPYRVCWNERDQDISQHNVQNRRDSSDVQLYLVFSLRLFGREPRLRLEHGKIKHGTRGIYCVNRAGGHLQTHHIALNLFSLVRSCMSSESNKFGYWFLCVIFHKTTRMWTRFRTSYCCPTPNFSQKPKWVCQNQAHWLVTWSKYSEPKQSHVFSTWALAHGLNCRPVPCEGVAGAMSASPVVCKVVQFTVKQRQLHVSPPANELSRLLEHKLLATPVIGIVAKAGSR